MQKDHKRDQSAQSSSGVVKMTGNSGGQMNVGLKSKLAVSINNYTDNKQDK
jgi:hypothetical protein